ncbi:hypothetical protein ED733_005828 [Metarhizium rileyi]|uniref:Uncharacterized protein n=1 Tax=Metarhizium rileyi (strain RCEF 4871) TaxID=1649241 RepID=A0A5C6GJL3_METRR|nr:hypothetical protein ED733_005828 [Metarhizium rileyi]
MLYDLAHGVAFLTTLRSSASSLGFPLNCFGEPLYPPPAPFKVQRYRAVAIRLTVPGAPQPREEPVCLYHEPTGNPSVSGRRGEDPELLASPSLTTSHAETSQSAGPIKQQHAKLYSCGPVSKACHVTSMTELIPFPRPLDDGADRTSFLFKTWVRIRPASPRTIVMPQSDTATPKDLPTFQLGTTSACFVELGSVTYGISTSRLSPRMGNARRGDASA